MAGFVWQYEVRNSQISASGRLQDFRIGKLALQVSPGCHGLAGLALPIVQFISNFLPLYTLSLHLHLCNGKTQSSDKVLRHKVCQSQRRRKHSSKNCWFDWCCRKGDTQKNLVAEWIHFTLFGIILPTIKLKVYTFGGL